MITANIFAEYLYHQIYKEREIKYYLIKGICKEPVKKYADNLHIIGNALLKMLEDGEYH